MKRFCTLLVAILVFSAGCSTSTYVPASAPATTENIDAELSRYSPLNYADYEKNLQPMQRVSFTGTVLRLLETYYDGTYLPIIVCVDGDRDKPIYVVGFDVNDNISPSDSIEIYAETSGITNSYKDGKEQKSVPQVTVMYYENFGPGEFQSIPEPTIEPTPDIWNGSGMFKVGTDIPSGEYYAKCTSSVSAYMAVYKDSTGEFESLISNENFSDTYIFTVTKGQYLEITRAEFAPSSKVPPQTEATTGMLRVGVDIKPGEYKLIPDSDGRSAYLCVYSNSKHSDLSNIVTNDNFDTIRYITVKKGQYLYLSRCSIEK